MRHEFASGDVVGRCIIRKKVGSGSMGVVYEAHHTTLSIDVAVKVMHNPPTGPDGEEWRERLRREARIAARLNHPSLVRVLDFGEETGSPYIVMEFVRGQTLETLLAERGHLDENLALRILGQVATGLQAAHAAGIIHRDLKPANLLIGLDGNIRIADLGLARDPYSAAITRPSGIAGTPHYMAPESLDSAIVPDHRVDLYALGILLYRMLYGRLPFGGNLHQVLAGHLHGQPDWDLPDGIRISPGSQYLIRRLLEKWPDKRLQTAVEVVQACRELLARLASQQRILAEQSARRQAPTSSGTGTHLGRVLRERLRSESELRSGITITHATARERLVAWLLLVVLVFGALRGIQKFVGHPGSEGRAPDQSGQTAR